MKTIQVELTDEQQQTLEALARERKTTTDQLLQEAVDRMADNSAADEQEKFRLWQEAMLKVEGIWADRDDLPDFEDIRRSLDRDLWSR